MGLKSQASSCRTLFFKLSVQQLLKCGRVAVKVTDFIMLNYLGDNSSKQSTHINLRPLFFPSERLVLIQAAGKQRTRNQGVQDDFQTHQCGGN